MTKADKKSRLAYLRLPSHFNKTTELSASACSGCGAKLDRCSGEDVPVPGDITMCAYCGDIHIFGPDLALRGASDAETTELMADPTVAQIRMAILTSKAKREGRYVGEIGNTK